MVGQQAVCIKNAEYIWRTPIAVRFLVIFFTQYSWKRTRKHENNVDVLPVVI